MGQNMGQKWSINSYKKCRTYRQKSHCNYIDKNLSVIVCIASSCNSERTWLYVSRVMLMFACPKIWLTTFTGTPASRALVASSGCEGMPYCVNLVLFIFAFLSNFLKNLGKTLISKGSPFS